MELVVARVLGLIWLIANFVSGNPLEQLLPAKSACLYYRQLLTSTRERFPSPGIGNE